MVIGRQKYFLERYVTLPKSYLSWGSLILKARKH
jgi:hypothetical protein